jgi:methylmalonyl-CoA mutase N-terminal domain/subunit
VPKWNTISISGYHIREAGSTAVQEIAFTLANAKSYLKAAIDKGLDIDVFGQRLSFFFNAHNNFFEEIAKFRAARRMWSKMAKDMGAKNPKAMMLRFHTQTGGATLQAQQPENNIMRVTLQALAAVMGGTQSLHTNGFDEALSLPTENAARTALRTQQIIAFESGVIDTVDPMGGSYFVEELTNQIEAAAWAYIEKIDAMGGSVSAIEQGYMQKEIADAAYRYQMAIEHEEKIIVGVNKFSSEHDVMPPIMRVDDSIRIGQMEKLKQLRAERNNDLVQTGLGQIKQAATDGTNVMPFIIEAVENYTTLGEIADTFRDVFGEYRA